MKRLAIISVVLVAIAVAVVVVVTTSSGGRHPYEVRAIFDDASFAVPGEDVRIAGAPVGTIQSLAVTDLSGRGGPNSCKQTGSNCKASVTMTVGASGFTPFRQNATCAIRPQSLIGEKYVDCNPGTSAAPPLTKITSGPGAGTFLLPVTHTSSPVDTDLVQNIYREPVRQWFGIIINEFGTGLAARGSDLNQVIRRANPALGYTDQVVKILAKQNKQLAQLARDSDTVLTPLAQDRQAIRQWVLTANTTSVATAQQAGNTALSFHLLPQFLRQLNPLLVDLGALADQATPVLNASTQAAPALARQYQLLASFNGKSGFADIARRSLISLGNAAQKQGPLLVSTIPLDKQLLNLANAGLPAFTNLDKLTSSLFRTGAIEQLMALLFNGTNAVNGFDSSGHYIRTEAIVGGCTAYSKQTVGGCSANFTHQTAAADVPTALDVANTSRAAHTPKVARLIKAAHKSGLQSSNSKTLEGLMHYLLGAGA
jgi:phospholipid/cholesterol/gamma-HCH transport system substrate-binding protein